jgi:hypothetical protein
MLDRCADPVDDRCVPLRVGAVPEQVADRNAEMSALYLSAIVGTARRESARDEARAERVDIVQLCFSGIGGGVVEIEHADNRAVVGEAHVKEVEVTVDYRRRHRRRDEPCTCARDRGDHVRRRGGSREGGDRSAEVTNRTRSEAERGAFGEGHGAADPRCELAVAVGKSLAER